jgi:hypothetical protein
MAAEDSYFPAMVSYSCSYIASEQFTGSPSLAKMPVTAIIVLTLTPWTAQPQLNNKLGKL